MKNVREMTNSEIDEFIYESICPQCNRQITQSIEKTEDWLETISSTCPQCKTTFMVDRLTTTVPGEILSAHQYLSLDTPPVETVTDIWFHTHLVKCSLFHKGV